MLGKNKLVGKKSVLRIVAILLAAMFLVSAIPNNTFIENVKGETATGEPTGTKETKFDLTCEEPNKDVGAQTGKYTTEYRIDVTNYVDMGGGILTTPKSLDNTDPTVYITYPTNGQTVDSTVTITAYGKDNVGGSGMDKMEFYI
ncbi:MAG: Ig-like domain-containing protein, partial [Thermoplasmatales archaeon]|nr:Ig-like domain-containing protein [Thermoplasmatales archaeon]